MENVRKPRVVGYARVSTDDQTTALQLDALRAYRHETHGPCTEILQEVGVSGSMPARKRPVLGPLLDPDSPSCLQPGDTLVVWRLDRLGRSMLDLVNVVSDLQKKSKAHLVSIQEQMKTDTAVGTLMFHMIVTFAQFERDVIADRTRAGLAATRARGTKLGPKSKITPELLAELNDRAGKENHERLFAEIAAKHGVSLRTVYRAYAQIRAAQPTWPTTRYVLSRDLPKESTVVE